MAFLHHLAHPLPSLYLHAIGSLLLSFCFYGNADESFFLPFFLYLDHNALLANFSSCFLSRSRRVPGRLFLSGDFTPIPPRRLSLAQAILNLYPFFFVLLLHFSSSSLCVSPSRIARPRRPVPLLVTPSTFVRNYVNLPLFLYNLNSACVPFDLTTAKYQAFPHSSLPLVLFLEISDRFCLGFPQMFCWSDSPPTLFPGELCDLPPLFCPPGTLSFCATILTSRRLFTLVFSFARSASKDFANAPRRQRSRWLENLQLCEVTSLFRTLWEI